MKKLSKEDEAFFDNLELFADVVSDDSYHYAEILMDYHLKLKELRKMKNKEMFIQSLEVLFWSWGSDTPEEVYWGANKQLDWYEKEYNVSLGIRFERNQETFETNYEDVIKAIRNA